MDPAHSWISREQIHALVANLSWCSVQRAVAPHRPVPREHRQHHRSTSTWTDQAPVPAPGPAAARNVPAPRRVPNVVLGPPSSGSSPSLPPPPTYSGHAGFETTATKALAERLDDLLDWVSERTGQETVFVADGEGQLLAWRRRGSRTEAIVRIVERFLVDLESYINAPVGGEVNLHMGQRQVIATWHDTSRGRVFLGMVGTAAVPAQAPEGLNRALRSAFDEPVSLPEASGRLTHGDQLLDLIRRSGANTDKVLLRVSLETGLPIALLRMPQELTPGELDDVSAAVHRVLERRPS